ncbi:MAG: hypothetical protein L0K46_10025, partial [Yaniella sp.]|nr:hypothetical protein [Yaniella sp.]
MTQTSTSQSGFQATPAGDGRQDMTVGSLTRLDKTRSRRSRFLRRFGAHKLALTGGIILIVVTVVALFGPMFTP